jgi:hypothetical protein
MHYLDEYITEQTERNILAGQSTIALEYKFTTPYPYESFDNDEITDALFRLARVVNSRGLDYARRVFDMFCKSIREAVINPARKEAVWRSVLATADRLKKENFEEEND